MIDDLSPVPKVAAKHVCGGPSCYFCEWSNPTLELPDEDTNTHRQKTISPTLKG